MSMYQPPQGRLVTPVTSVTPESGSQNVAHHLGSLFGQLPTLLVLLTGEAARLQHHIDNALVINGGEVAVKAEYLVVLSRSALTFTAASQ